MSEAHLDVGDPQPRQVVLRIGRGNPLQRRKRFLLVSFLFLYVGWSALGR
jgi:hypothetical protein